MFITKKHYNKMKKAIDGLDKVQDDIVDEILNMQDRLNLNIKIISNLAQVVESLVTEKNSKEVIATTEDGTEITIGHVLNSVNLMPIEEDDWQSAWL